MILIISSRSVWATTRRRPRVEDPVGLADVREAGNAVDVHDVRRAREAQLHQRDEALPSGEDLRLLAESREQRRGVVERCGGVILERGWNHGGHPFRWSEPKGPGRGRNRTGSPWAGQGPRVWHARNDSRTGDAPAPGRPA